MPFYFIIFSLFLFMFHSFFFLEKSFQSELRVRCPKVLCTLLTQKFVDSLERIKQLPCLCLNGNTAAYILHPSLRNEEREREEECLEREKGEGGLSGPPSYNRRCLGAGLKGRVGPPKTGQLRPPPLLPEQHGHD